MAMRTTVLVVWRFLCEPSLNQILLTLSTCRVGCMLMQLFFPSGPSSPTAFQMKKTYCSINSSRNRKVRYTPCPLSFEGLFIPLRPLEDAKPCQNSHETTYGGPNSLVACTLWSTKKSKSKIPTEPNKSGPRFPMLPAPNQAEDSTEKSLAPLQLSCYTLAV